MIQLVLRVERCAQPRGSLPGFVKPFSTTNEGVSELGLSLAYGTIKEHDGRVSSNTVPGEGLAYLVELPIRTPLPSSTESAVEVSGFIGRKHVLVVGADEKTLVLLQEIVRHLGHDSMGTTSAEQAFQLVAANEYDLIITDMALPTAPPLDFYSEVLTLRPGLAQRILFISDGVISDQASLFLKEVDCYVITKPFRVADIEMGMRQVLGE